MSKSLQKQSNQDMIQKIKQLDAGQVKKVASTITQANCDPKKVIKEFKKVAGKFYFGSQKKSQEVAETYHEKLEQVAILGGLDNHYPLAETVDERYRSLVIELANQLIQEYNCQTPSERMLAEMVAQCYIKVLDYSKILNNALQTRYLSHELNGLCSILSKLIDKCHRQFITALTTLKQIKSPSLEVNVKTKTAFVAQKQEINAFKNEVSIKNTKDKRIKK